MDFSACFRKLEELQYKGPYLIEMWYDPQQDNLHEITAARKFVEDQYRKALAALKEEGKKP